MQAGPEPGHIQPVFCTGGLDGFQGSLCPCALDESSLSIGRVNNQMISQQTIFKDMAEVPFLTQ